MNGENKLSEINSLCDSTELSDIELGNDGTENKIDGSVELFGLIYGSTPVLGSDDGTSDGATSTPHTDGEDNYKTLVGTNIELDKESSDVVDKVYNSSVWSFVFVVIFSPLIIRYTLATSSQESLHFFSNVFWSQSSDWGTGLSILEWTILLMLAMQNFMGLVPSTSLLCGKPTSVKSGENVECTGQAVIGTCTPFLTENEAIFMRSLLGRFATAFHTIGSRHDIRGLYVDAIVNEVRSTEGDGRILQWMAWVDFIEYLAKLKLEEMAWPFKRSPEESCSDTTDAVDDNLATSVPLLSANDEEAGYIHKSLDPSPIIRTINVGSRTVTYELETTNLTFKGLKTVSLRNDKLGNQNLMMKSESSEAKWDELGHDNVNRNFNLEDLLPLICFLDGWLEVTRRRDINRDHNNKRVALEDIFNHAPCSKYFTGAILIEVQRRLRELFDVFIGMNKHYRPTSRFTHISKEDPFVHRDESAELKWTVTRSGYQDWTLAFVYWSRGKLNQGSDGTGNEILLETVKVKPGALVHLNSHDYDSWIKSRQQTFKVLSMNGSALRLKAWPAVNTIEHTESFFAGSNIQIMAQLNSEDIEAGKSPHSSSSLRRSLMLESADVDVKDVTLYTQHRGKVGAIDTFKHYLRLRGQKWASEEHIEVARPQTFMAVIDARHMIVEPQIFINQALPYFARGKNGESTKGFAPSSDCMLVQYPQYFPNVIDDTFNSRNGLHWTLNQLLQDFSKTCVSTGSNAVWDISSEQECSFLHVGNVRVDDTAATLAQIKEKLCVHFPCFVANGISRTKPVDMLDTWHRWNGGNVEMFWTIVFSRYSYLQMLGRVVFYLYLSACFLPSVYFYAAWLAFLAGTTIYAIYYEKKQGKLPFRDINILFIFLQMPTTGLFRIMNFVAMAAAPISMAFFHEIPMFATPSRKLFWVLWVFLVRQPQLHIVDNLIEICRVFNPATKKGLWDFRLVMWRACRVEGFAMPFAIMGFFEGTCNAFRALLFDADITYWNQIRVDSKEVTRRYKQMMATASYCSLDFISNVFSYLSIRTQQSRRLWSTPRPWTTIYVSVMALLQVLCIIYTWLTAEDRTLIVAVLVTCMFNFLLLKDTVIALIKPVRLLVSKEYQIEYLFTFFTLVLMASVVTGLSFEPILKMLTV